MGVSEEGYEPRLYTKQEWQELAFPRQGNECFQLYDDIQMIQ